MRFVATALLLAICPVAVGEVIIDDFSYGSNTANNTTTVNNSLDDAIGGTVTSSTTGGFGSSLTTGGGGIAATIGNNVDTAVISYDFSSALNLLTTPQTALVLDLFQNVLGNVDYVLEIDDAGDASSAPAVFTGSLTAGESILVTRDQIGAALAGDIDTITLTVNSPDAGGAQFSSASARVLAVPEPSTYVLFGLTGLGFVWYLRRRQTLADAC